MPRLRIHGCAGVQGTARRPVGNGSTLRCAGMKFPAPTAGRRGPGGLPGSGFPAPVAGGRFPAPMALAA
jgi:hypothetical protein